MKYIIKLEKIESEEMTNEILIDSDTLGALVKYGIKAPNGKELAVATICECCGDLCRMNWLHYNYIDNKYYCDDCITRCADCGKIIYDKDEAICIDSEYYCDDCVKQCADCGEYFKIDDLHETVYGEYVCDDCVERNYFYCECCGDLCRNEDAISIDGGERIYCEDCADCHAYKCDDCGEYFSDNNEMYNIENDYSICDYCFRHGNFIYCECCECYINANGDYCDYCSCRGDSECYYQDTIRDYHDNPTICKYGKMRPSWRGLWRGLGIELEIGGKRDYCDSIASELTDRLDRLVDNYNDELYYMHDSSIDNGFEIITQPHTIKSFYDMKWREILDAIKSEGYTSHNNGTCGLHVHVSREMLGATQQKQELSIAKLIYFYQTFWNDCLLVSRRENSDAVQWANNWTTDCEDAHTKKGASKIAKRKGYHVDRYHAVNTTNDATIEHRLMRGTLNYNTFMATIDFILTITKNATKLSWKQCTDAKNWLKGIKQNTKEYILQRSAFINVFTSTEV